MTQENLVSILQEYFSQKDGIVLALLYGSFAKNTFSAKSDVDIAVCATRKIDGDDLLTMQAELAILCGREIDLVDLRTAEGIFLHQIMTTALRIKFEENTYVYFANKALFFYEDYYPILRRTQEEKLKRLIYG